MSSKMPPDESPFRATYSPDLHLAKRLRALIYASFGLIALAFVAIGLTLLITLNRTALDDPFGDFAVQEVHNEVVGVEKPAAIVGQPIFATGTKCYNEPVKIRGTLSWKLVSPFVEILGVTESTATRIAGCESFEFRNSWPTEAIELSRDLLDQGFTVIWQITGTETPSNGGVSKVWETQSFRAVEHAGG